MAHLTCALIQPCPPEWVTQVNVTCVRWGCRERGTGEVQSCLAWTVHFLPVASGDTLPHRPLSYLGQ